MITQKLDLNLIHGQVRPRVNVSQFDSGTRTLEIAVYNNTARFTLLGTYTVSIEGRKPDNTAFQYDGIIDTVNNVATFDVTEQMTAVYGDVVVEMVINDGDDRIGTGNFILAVEAAPLNDDSVISESVLPLVQRAAEIAETIDDVVLPIRVEKDFAPIISMSDAISKNAIDIKAKIDPVQDLHGYASPWVGGAGKNLLPLNVADIKALNTSGTWNGNTLTVANMTAEIQTDADNNVTGIMLKGTPNATVLFYFSKSFDSAANVGNLLNGYPSGYTGSGTTVMYRFYTNDNTGDFNILTDDGAIQNIGTCNFVIRINNGYAIPSSGLLFKPMIRRSSVIDPTFEPYTNICPITGHSELNLYSDGLNVWDEEWESGRFQVSTGNNVADANFIRSKNLTRVIPNTDYYVQFPSTCPQFVVLLYDRNQTYTTQYISKSASGVLSIPAGVYYIKFYAQQPSYGNNICINVSNASKNGQYEPYAGNVYTIDLDGTRYGGTLDVTTGELTLTHGFIEFDGSVDENWAWVSADHQAYPATIAGAKAKSPIISDQYKGVIVNSWGNLQNGEIAMHPSADGVMRLQNNAYSSLSDLTTALSNTPLHVVYELTTPQTIALDPQDVLMLWAYNTLFGDTGDISLIYDATGILRIAHEKLDIDTFKAVVAASSDFADFKTRVAAL